MNVNGCNVFPIFCISFSSSTALFSKPTGIEPQQEQDLIDGCIHGDRYCQKQLYETHAGKLYAICLRYTKCPEEAKDALQEGFIKIYTNLQHFRGSGAFEGWMRRIMVNCILERFRKEKPLFCHQDAVAEMEDPTSSHSVIDKLAAEDLVEMINDLAPGYRVIFNLYAVEGYSHKEIAKKLDISEGTSKSQLARARKILQERILKLREKHGQRLQRAAV